MKHTCDYKFVGLDASKIMPGFVLQMGQGVYKCQCGNVQIKGKTKHKKKRKK